MNKFELIFFCAMMCTVAFAKPEQDRNMLDLDAIPEEPCVMQGGVCVKEADCRYPTAVKGLCPQQRSQGIECCYDISQRELRCKKRGGDCVAANECHPSLIFRQATDCQEDTVCCIFVH